MHSTAFMVIWMLGGLGPLQHRYTPPLEPPIAVDAFDILTDPAVLRLPRPPRPPLYEPGVASSWLGAVVKDTLPAEFRVEHWRRLAHAIGLSRTQWRTSLNHYTVFRTDEARSTVWFDGIDLAAEPHSAEFVTARRRLADARTDYIDAVAAESGRFFAILDEFVLSGSQLATSSMARRACERRIRLSSVFPRSTGLHEDPEWIVLQELRLALDMSSADIAMLQALTTDWRGTADRLAHQLQRASSEYVGSSRGGWEAMFAGRGIRDDLFRPEREASEQLMRMQEQWLDHSMRYFDLVEGLVAPSLLRPFRDSMARFRCPPRNILHVDELRRTAGLLADVDTGLAAHLHRRILETESMLDGIADELCRLDRRRPIAHHVWIPLLASDFQAHVRSIDELGAEWFSTARRELAELRESCDALLAVDAALAARVAESIDAAAGALDGKFLEWEGFAGTFLRSDE